MIAIGKPFIDILIENQLSLEEYTVIYCVVYDKKDLIKSYSRNVNTINSELVKNLQDRGYITMTDGKWEATDQSDVFIRDLVDSYSNQKSERSPNRRTNIELSFYPLRALQAHPERGQGMPSMPRNSPVSWRSLFSRANS